MRIRMRGSKGQRFLPRSVCRFEYPKSIILKNEVFNCCKSHNSIFCRILKMNGFFRTVYGKREEQSKQTQKNRSDREGRDKRDKRGKTGRAKLFAANIADREP